MPSALEFYEERLRDRAGALARILQRFDLVAWARLLTFGGALAVVVGTLWRSWGILGWAVAAFLTLCFIGLVMIHARLTDQKAGVASVITLYERSRKRLSGSWPEFPETGEKFASDDHPYALDLDIFGRASLFQILSERSSEFGHSTLARWLSGGAASTAIAQRQEAVAELATRTAVRESLALAGRRSLTHGADFERLAKWAEDAPSLRAHGALRWFAFLSPLVFFLTVLGAVYSLVPTWLFLIPYIVNILVQRRLWPKLAPTIDAVGNHSAALGAFVESLAVLEKGAFSCSWLKGLIGNLNKSGKLASKEISRLARIVSFLDARENEVFKALIAPALLWEIHCVVAIEKWQRQVGPNVRQWFESFGNFEAAVCLSAFRFEHPDYVFPEIVDAPQVLDAQALGHPLIDQKRRVDNDVSLPHPGFVLLVTGSNMSGKSTLLRAIGVNAVLAMAGAPVCAKRLKIAPCEIASSMRVSDNLRDGVSRFYAELLKIKRVVEMAEKGHRVLFLLDEILHGTNSRERHIGARSIIRSLVRDGAMGAVSTHDLSLAGLEDALPGQVRNVHFQENVDGDKMTFDYQLRPGVVTSGNALRWMRVVGLDVELE